jgi:hypothetical protein
MNLTEYLNQGSNPTWQSNVGLNIEEVTIYRVGLHYNVQVPKLEEKFKDIGFNATYFVESNGRALWTTDENGHKKSMSCFYLNFDPTNLKSNSIFKPINK